METTFTIVKLQERDIQIGLCKLAKPQGQESTALHSNLLRAYLNIFVLNKFPDNW